ncbi:MAG: hypothetical protein KGM49_05745 [Sphingomonadales bacterium]|nr:hypothetical protein [Sphingomonadales bacterium]
MSAPGENVMAEGKTLERRVVAKLTWRILPLIFLSYLVAVLDRANVSYASVQMNASLGFSAAVYGLGVGLFCALVFMCGNAVTYSAPKLLMQATGWSLGSVGFFAALTNIPTVIVMLAVCWHSDLRRAPHLHMGAMTALSALGALGMALAFKSPPGTAIVAMLAAHCLFNTASTVVGPLTMPAASATLHPASRAVAFAAINTISQVGNFLGPVLWGYAATRTGSFQFGLNAIAFILLVPLGLILVMRQRGERRPGRNGQLASIRSA